MQGRVAIVTGGTRGIGAAITRVLTRDGAHVAAVYAGNTERAEEIRAEVEAAGGSITLHQGDVGDRDFCRNLVAALDAEHGHVDHLVNNAGLLREAKLGAVTAQEWDQAIGVNLSGPFYLAQAAAEPMIREGFGRIVNIGSVTAMMGSPVEVAYGAAKAGLVGLTRGLARAVVKKGITVNLVVPGIFETDMANELAPAAQEAVRKMIPIGRRGNPMELAAAVRFLLDDSASYLTGSVITVDGGLSMGD